jgi:ActR/RegA family two-component response regulator
MTGVMTREKPRLERPVKPVAAKNTLECLIVSSDRSRRESLSRAAAENGWSTVVCADSQTARRMANRIAVKLAIVDMEDPSLAESGGLRELSVELSCAGGPLLVLCGADGDVHQEIWARQLGTWFYLAGMADTEAMALLCSEARQVVEKTSSQQTLPLA